jgi:S1-C subfamily serine protease
MITVVSILDELDREVVLGTIIEANGWIATIASILPAQPRCRMPDARVVAAQVVGMDPAFDLALLKVPMAGLSAADWAEKFPAIARSPSLPSRRRSKGSRASTSHENSASALG